MLRLDHRKLRMKVDVVVVVDGGDGGMRSNAISAVAEIEIKQSF